MKKLILLLALAFVMCGCNPKRPYSIVTKVKKSDINIYEAVVTTDNQLYFYTNEEFKVGDTVQITKKN